VALQRDPDAPVEKTPPQNIELEMCVLGGIMLEPQEAYPVAADYLKRESFYLDGHGIVFELMGQLHARGLQPDYDMVLDELRSRGLLEKAGGAGVLLSMLNSVASAAGVAHHAKKVAEKAHLRAMIRAATQIIEECYRQELPLEQILDQAEAAVLQLSGDSVESEFTQLSEVLMEYWEGLSVRSDELKRRRAAGERNPRISVGIPTGFLDLDQITGGLRPSELTIIAARTGMGKTALGLNMAHNMSVERDVPVALFSLEMGVEQLAARLLCMGTKYTDPQTRRIRGVSTGMLQNPDLTDAEWNVLTQTYNKLLTAPIYLDDSSLLSVQMLKSKVRRLHAHYGVQCVIVDYLQLMQGTSSTENRVQEVSEISRGLKQIARELKIPVVALSQLSRQVEARQSKRPQLSDLRESGAIEQDADIVMFIHRTDYYEEKQRTTGDPDYDEPSLPEAEIIVAKNRNGPTDTVFMRWFPQITRFLDRSRL
jgi:replicative DNA helicase